ncbi:hypothetical protein Tco_1483860 [Tanacetum coccineum]
MPKKDRAAVRAEIEILRRERPCLIEAGEHLSPRVAASGLQDDLAIQDSMRTQALEAGARIDTLEDTGSSS